MMQEMHKGAAAQLSPAKQALQNALITYTPKRVPQKRSAKQKLNFDHQEELAAQTSPSPLEFESTEQCQAYAITIGLQTYSNIDEIIATYVINMQSVLAKSLYHTAYNDGTNGESADTGIKKFQSIIRKLARIDPHGLNKLENMQYAYQAYEKSDLAAVKTQTINLLSFAQEKLQQMLTLVEQLEFTDLTEIVATLTKNIEERIIQNFPLLLPALKEYDIALYNAYSAQLQQSKRMIETLQHLLDEKKIKATEPSTATPQQLALLKAEEKAAEAGRRSVDIANEADEEFAQQQEKLESAQEHIQSLLIDLDKAIKRADEAEKQLADAEQVPDTELADKQELIRKVKDLQKINGDANSENENLNRQIEELRGQLQQALELNAAYEKETQDLKNQLALLQQEMQLAIATSQEFSDNNTGLVGSLTPRRKIHLQRSHSKRVTESPIRRQRSSSKKQTPRSNLGLTQIPEKEPTNNEIMQDILVSMMIYCTKLSELLIYLNTIAASCDTNEYIEHHLMMAIAYLRDEKSLSTEVRHNPKLKQAYIAAKTTLEDQAARKVPEKKSSFFGSGAKATKALFPSPEHALTAVERAKGRLQELASVTSIYDEIRRMNVTIQRFINLQKIIAGYQAQIDTLNTENLGVVELDEEGTAERKAQIKEIEARKKAAEREFDELYPETCVTFEKFVTLALRDMRHHLSYVSGHLLGPRSALARFICQKLNDIYRKEQLNKNSETRGKRGKVFKRLNAIEKVIQAGSTEQLSEDEQSLLTEMDYPNKTAQTLQEMLKIEMQTLQQSEEQGIFILQLKNDKSNKASEFLHPVNENIIDALHAIFDTVTAAIEDKKTDDAHTKKLRSQVKLIEECNKGFENAKLATMQASANSESFLKLYYDSLGRILRTPSKRNSEKYLQIVEAVQTVETMCCERFASAGFSGGTTIDKLNEMKASLQKTDTTEMMDRISPDIFMQTLIPTVNEALQELVRGNLASDFLCGLATKTFVADCQAAQDKYQQDLSNAIAMKGKRG